MATDGAGWQKAKVTSAVYVAGPATLADGDYDVQHMDSAHGQMVGGQVAAGSTAAGYPIQTGVVDGAGKMRAALGDANGLLQAQPPTASAWSLTNTSNAAAQATASKAASVTGVKHVCTGFMAQLHGDATGNADLATINVRDGATGAGTVLATFGVSLASGANAYGTPVVVTGLNLVGTANTAMTIEASTAGATHTIQIVNAWGYDTK